ncbi:MAG: hypothetical protein LUG60_11055 [Erysipelotrichaceae bacterium]|nr:hypothetical protein [Erysipelotrichaceae bacterium]
MYDYEIRRLSRKFYSDYSHSLYPEILTKINRNYNIVIFELDCLSECYVCIPFRSEMHHNNGYRFRYSKRSKKHFSGLDFSKLVIITKIIYIGESTMIDSDEFNEFYAYKDYIHNNLKKYICDYVNHYKGTKIMNKREFNRKYQYSTLKYFHKELGI